MSTEAPKELLDQAVDATAADGFDPDGYTFTQVDGATQAVVWKGVPSGAGPTVALRLTPKPVQLVRRIATLVDQAGPVEVPRTLATGQIENADRTWTVHLCTWIGVGAPVKADMRLLGQHLARLHEHLAAAAATVDLTDRRLSFERSPTPPAEQQLPAWYVARHLWRDRIYAWLSAQNGQMRPQPIHGDMHWGNVVATASGGFGFIDFDKVMFAEPVFDLAKLIATGLFRTRDRARFQVRRTTELLEGYETVRPLSDIELFALEGLAVLLNEQTAYLGNMHDIEEYRRDADAVASWWITRRGNALRDPLGIRAARQAPTRSDEENVQPTLWPDSADPLDPES